jgi:hypothetical protein
VCAGRGSSSGECGTGHALTVSTEYTSSTISVRAVSTVQYSTIQHYTILYYTILYYTILYNTMKKIRTICIGRYTTHIHNARTQFPYLPSALTMHGPIGHDRSRVFPVRLTAIICVIIINSYW